MLGQEVPKVKPICILYPLLICFKECFMVYQLHPFCHPPHDFHDWTVKNSKDRKAQHMRSICLFAMFWADDAHFVIVTQECSIIRGKSVIYSTLEVEGIWETLQDNALSSLQYFLLWLTNFIILLSSAPLYDFHDWRTMKLGKHNTWYHVCRIGHTHFVILTT